MPVDRIELIHLEAAVSYWRSATSAWQRRIALDVYRAAALPNVVGDLIDEYRAAAPTNAELDGIARELHYWADRLEAFGTNLPEAAGYVAVIAISGERLERNSHMAFVLQHGQEVDLAANYTDRHGNPATVESQTWSSSDDGVLGVNDNGDGTATATADAIGTAQVQLVADARYGEEVNEIRGVLDVEVVAAEAVNVTITPGEPVDSTNPTPEPEA